MTARAEPIVSGIRPAFALHHRSLVIDLHTDALYEHVRGRKDITQRSDVLQVDIPRLKQGGVNAQVFAIWTNPDLFKPGKRATFVLKAIDAFKRICRRCPEDIALALGPGDIRTIRASGRIAGILGVEGGHALEGDLANLDRFYRRGVRVLTLTWNNSNPFARSCMSRDGPRRGLTRLGHEAVKRMNRLGIVIDLSHASDRAFSDVLDTSTAPVICSHSACRALRRFPRNLTDEQLKALGQARGVIGIVFLPYFLTRAYRKATIEHVLNHIEHSADIAGINAVAIGSDFDGFGDSPPKGLEDVTRMPAFTEGLLRRGFSEPDIKKILGENFLRVWKEVTRKAGNPSRLPD